MRRLILVYSPRSSRFADVKKDILSHISKLRGYQIGKYEVAPTDLDDNIKKLSKILRDDDLVISAGGDATGAISANAIIKSGKDVTLAALPYGNFNDLARTLGTKTLEEILALADLESPSRDIKLGQAPFSASREKLSDRAINKFYPLEIRVDGEFFRYATCYVTIGMTAEAVRIYDTPTLRKKLKKGFGRKISSYTTLASWYFKNRHRHIFIPPFILNGKKQSPKISDYAAVNGRFMARVMKGGNDYLSSDTFHHETDCLTSFFRLLKLMCRSILSRIPGTPTTGDTIEFLEPSTITLQAEGESKTFENIKKIEIKKGTKCLKVITTLNK